jgi:hypothetical protein
MKFSIFFRFLLLAGLIFTAASCGDDETADPTSSNPLAELVAEAGFVSGTADLVAPGDPILAKVRGIKGDSPMNTLTVFQDGVAMSLDDISYDGVPASANPRLLFDAEKDEFTFEVELKAHDTGVATYSFEIADDDGNTGSISIDITVGEGLSITNTAQDIVSATAGGFVGVPVNVMIGLAPLLELSVTVDGNPIDATRLRFLSDDAGAEFDANPYLIPDDQANGFEGTLYIQAQDTPGDVIYAMTVSDTDGNVATATVTLRTGTPVDGEYVAIILNNADGPNQGGIDLRTNADEAVTVSSLSGNADIVDKGIDLAQPLATNWYQQIVPANGAELRVPDFTQVENFTYESAESKEAIQEAYNTGISKGESDVVEIGDLFLVKKGNDLFLMKCTNVVVTSDNNLDFMEFSIKQAFDN